MSEGAVSQRQGSRGGDLAQRGELSLPPIPRQNDNPSPCAPAQPQAEPRRPISFVIQPPSPAVGEVECPAEEWENLDEPPDWLKNGEPPDIDSEKVTAWIEEFREREGFCRLVDAGQVEENVRVLRDRLNRGKIRDK